MMGSESLFVGGEYSNVKQYQSTTRKFIAEFTLSKGPPSYTHTHKGVVGKLVSV